MKQLELQELITRFKDKADSQIVFFLDYDGTLVPIITEPEKSFPDQSLLDILDAINKRFELYLVTGRSLREMNTFVGSRYNLIALHGAAISLASGDIRTVEGYGEYRKKCNEIFSREGDFEERFPGVHLINKDGGVVFTKWHLDPILHHKLDKEVCSIARETGMRCYIGKMIVEIRIPGPNKGDVINRIRKGRPALIAGDDTTDEDAFALNNDAFTIKVGDGETAAKYRVKDYLEFRKFLEALQA